MKHLMIDLETLGTRVNCPVVAIGAVFFDPDTGKLGSEFEAAISLSEAMAHGRADGDTIGWWLGQEQPARDKVRRGRMTSEQAFKKFFDFCKQGGDDIFPWGNGASFDISILDYAFPHILKVAPPWKFWNVRDCRTIKALASGIVTFSGEMQGTAHTALDDAKHQARWVSAFWQGLRGVEPKSVDNAGLSAAARSLPAENPDSHFLDL